MTIAVGKESYCIGDPIDATVTLTVEQDLEVDELYVELVEAAKYRHTEEGISSFPDIPEYHSERKILVSQSTLKAGLSHTYEVTLEIPSYIPPSYHGNLISIKWLIKAGCDIKMARDISAELEIPVLVTNSRHVPEVDSDVEVVTEDDCTLSLSLSDASIAEGETLHALLTVKPLNNFTASEIRAKVTLYEYIFNVVGHRIEQRIPIADKTQFEAEVEQSFPFDITVPVKNMPTVQTADFRAEQQLKVIVSRNMHSDYEVAKTLTVYNSAELS